MKVAGSNPAVGILYFIQKIPPKGYRQEAKARHFDCRISLVRLQLSLFLKFIYNKGVFLQ